MHPKKYDVSIFTLSEKINFSKKILPICLSPIPGYFPGKIATITGWGFTKDNYHHKEDTPPDQPLKLQDAKVHIMKNSECRKIAHR